MEPQNRATSLETGSTSPELNVNLTYAQCHKCIQMLWFKQSPKSGTDKRVSNLPPCHDQSICDKHLFGHGRMCLLLGFAGGAFCQQATTVSLPPNQALSEETVRTNFVSLLDLLTLTLHGRCPLLCLGSSEDMWSYRPWVLLRPSAQLQISSLAALWWFSVDLLCFQWGLCDIQI